MSSTKQSSTKQKANARCACKSGKKYKKCCKNKKQTTYRLDDDMSPFRYWLMKHGEKFGEFNWNPNTNKKLTNAYRTKCQMTEDRKQDGYIVAHPEYLKMDDVVAFMSAPARKGCQLYKLKNTNHGWYSHCFQNAYYFMKFKGYGKPKIGWLLTGFPGQPKKFPTGMTNITDGSFAAELHIVWEGEGKIIDPTPDYDDTMTEKMWVDDPALQRMIDNVIDRGFNRYMNVVGTIQRISPNGSGFLHKQNMLDWRCPNIMCGY